MSARGALLCGLLLVAALVSPAESAASPLPSTKRPRPDPTAARPQASDAGASGAGEAESGSLAAAPSEGDVLAANGLGSPACREGVQALGVARENCRTSGFAPSPAPTGDYAFDVHIDTGLAHFSNYLEASVQDAVQWGWMALVALVRALLVALEWCYSLNLLGAALMAQVADGLRAARATLTAPGLAVVMTIASALAVYHGLLRRRVAQTLGQVLAMLAMMVAGLWTIADPRGSVGTLATWVNEASVGALAAVAAGTPEHPDDTLAHDMRNLFADAVTGPWCFMEFGNVRWCRDPILLDARLRRAALAVAREERALASGAGASARLAVAALIERARNNGELFLALPANGVARNSINDSGSLLSVLCGGSPEATNCTGQTAAQAQFRTQHGTWARVVGLLLVWLGALAMLVLFGWIGLRLLAAAVLSLLLLLLAPAAVLAPALGDGGRGMFRAWATRLLGALTAKLVYSLLLGATLLMTNLLAGLTVLGWWMQWLLISAAWWLVFHERHELLGMARVGEHAPWAPLGSGSAAALGRRPGAIRRVRERTLHRATDAALIGAGRFAKRVIAPPPPTSERRVPVASRARRHARASGDAQVDAMLEHERGAALAAIERAPQTQEAISAKRTQLARVQLAARAAEERLAARREAGGEVGVRDLKRAVRLSVRAERVEGDIAKRQGALSAARALVADAQRAREQTGRPLSERLAQRSARFLDAQAALPERGRPNASGERRDYRQMAALGGEAAHEWEELDAERRHRAILRIDGELAQRTGSERSALAAGDADHAESHLHQPRTKVRRPATQEPRSALTAWLEQERQKARVRQHPPTLAERARVAAAARPTPPAPRDERLERRRRQFGREQRSGLD